MVAPPSQQLQTDLDVWLASYNQERPHQGYRNMGRRPIHRSRQPIPQRKGFGVPT